MPDPEEEIEITLPPNPANPTSQEQLQQIARGELPLEMVDCTTYDDETREISTEGCRVVGVESDGTLKCSCVKITNFMGFLRSGLSVLKGANYDVNAGSRQAHTFQPRSNIGFYFALGFSALLLLNVLLCHGLDRRIFKGDKYF